MNDTIFYMRSSTAPPFLQGLPGQLKLDFRNLVSLTDTQIVQLNTVLDSSPQFLDNKTLFSRLAQSFEEDLASSLTRTLRLMIRADTWEGGFEGILGSLPVNSDQVDEGNDGFSLEELQRLRQLRNRLASHWSSIERQAKAERLGKATGQALEKIELICDLRPIFNSTRTQVEGLIPITTLRVTVEGPDGLPTALEAILSREDVDRLSEIASHAKAKLEALVNLSSRFDIEIPHTESTNTTAK
jgi:hypothetical protein